MASVFLSCDRDDSDRARQFARALEKAGHNVWWDLHVRGGAQFSKVIEEALKAADVVVVLWSANVIESAWVRDEAAAGRDTGRLVPLIEPLAAHYRDNADVLDAYSATLGRIGRTRDCVAAASKAVKLDPLSPSRRNNFISALAYSGSFDAAERELAEAERLWPGTATVEDAKFRFHYRYGDPKSPCPYSIGERRWEARR